jgi:hypothetical protein
MRRDKGAIPLIGTALWAVTAIVAPLGAQETAATEGAARQAVVGHAATHTPSEANLVFELPGGETLTITVRDGGVLLNGEPLVSGDGSGLAHRLRALIEGAGRLETSDVVTSVQDLEAAGTLSESERVAADALSETLAKLAVVNAVFSDAVVADEAVASSSPPRARPAPRPHPPARQTASGMAATSTSLVGGIVGGLVNLAAVYLALAFMGLGFLFFAPRQLEVIADTVWHSFGRSFLAGLFAQPLILPVFGMLLVGLTLTVVGIVIVPFAVVGFLVALMLAVVGGFVAVARTLGEIYLRRKMARGDRVATWGSYRYVVYGLLGLLSIWLPTILLSRVPVAGDVLLVAATFVTWMIGTAGFGATLLSRGGVRATFVRRLDLALTDEQYWTAEGMPTQQPSHRVRRR